MLKKTACLLLCAILLAMFCACSPADPLSITTTSDELLLAMLDALTEQGTALRIDTDDTTGGENRVETTPEMLEKIATILTTSPAQRVEMKSLSGGYSNIMMQGGEVPVLIELFGNGGPDSDYPDNTVLWLQVGEQTAQYLYAAQIFAEVEEIVKAAIVPNTLEIEGDAIALQPAIAFNTSIGMYMHGAIQIDNMLLLLYGAENTTYLDVIEMPGGQSVHSQLFDAGALRIEKTGYLQYDYRIFLKDGTVQYHNSQDHSDVFTYEVPQQVLDAVGGNFSAYLQDYDVDPATGTVVYPDDNGLQMYKYGIFTTLLSNADITSEMLNYDLSEIPDDEFMPKYAEPRILNSGQTISTCLVLPGSQSGYAALGLYTVATGETQVFNGIFGAMVSGVTYLSDTCLVAHRHEADTIIDVLTGTATEHPRPEKYEGQYIEQYSADYERYVYTISKYLPSGVLETRYFYETPDDAFLATRGERAGVAAITPQYIILSTYPGGDLYAVEY